MAERPTMKDAAMESRIKVERGKHHFPSLSMYTVYTQE